MPLKWNSWDEPDDTPEVPTSQVILEGIIIVLLMVSFILGLALLINNT